MIKKSINIWAIYNINEFNRKKNNCSATYASAVYRYYGYTTVI